VAADSDGRAAQQAVVAILRAADAVRRRMAEALDPHGITGQQYNVLRILRGAHPEPLPTLEIGERLMERNPGITRLLERLEQKGLVRRERGDTDRRLVRCHVTSAGLALLADLDEPIARANEQVFAGFDVAAVRDVSRLLERLGDG
jgi:MarR family transcriptional regulator, organic hydroperoxide resistance regulator